MRDFIQKRNLISKLFIGIIFMLVFTANIVATSTQVQAAYQDGALKKNKVFYIWTEQPATISFLMNNDDTGENADPLKWPTTYNGYDMGSITVSGFVNKNSSNPFRDHNGVAKSGYKVTMKDVDVHHYTPYCRLIAVPSAGFEPKSLRIIYSDNLTGCDRTANEVHNLEQLDNKIDFKFFYIGYGFTASELELTSVEKTYKVSYNTNGGTGTFNTQTKKYTQNLSMHSHQPTREGYTFEGWKDSDGSSYSAGAQYSKNKDTTMTAQWKAKQYTVNYYTNKPSNASNNVKYNSTAKNGLFCTQKAYYDSDFTMLGEVLSLTGWTFTGWNTSANGKGQSYNPGQSARNLVTEGTVNLYAQWQPNVYTITLKGNGETVMGTSAIYEKFDTGLFLKSDCSGDSVTKVTLPNRVGYDFCGYVDDSGTVKINKDDGTFSFTRSSYTSDVTFTAKWEPKTFTIILDDNGGTGVKINGTRVFYEYFNTGYYTDDAHASAVTNSTQFRVPTLTGHKFGGYYMAQTIRGEEPLQKIIDENGKIVPGLNANLFTKGTTIYADIFSLETK